MAFSSSSQTNSSSSSIPSSPSLDFTALAKTLNFNLPIKLDRINFINWKPQVIAAIRALELDDFVDPTKISPPQNLPDGSSNPAYKNWRRSDQLLLCWLLFTVGEEIIGQVYQAQTALSAWQTLENLYAQISLARVLQLRQQLSTIQKESMTISDYIQKIKQIGDQLFVAGHKIPDSDLVMSALNGLGHEYDPVVVFLTHNMTTASLQDIQYSLMMHEQMIDQLNSISNQTPVSAHLTTVNSPTKQRNNNNQTRGRNGGRGGRNGGRGRGGR